MPIEAKIIPSPRPKAPQRLLSAVFLFVLRFRPRPLRPAPGRTHKAALPAQMQKKMRGKAGTTLQRVALFDVKIDTVLGGMFP